MKRYPSVLCLLFLAAVAVACSSGDPGGPGPLGTPPLDTVASCDPSDRVCLDKVIRLRGEAEPTARAIDPRIVDILLENEVIAAMIGDGVERQDYWLSITVPITLRHGDQGGSVIILFAEPVSYEGQVPHSTDPCDGHTVNERVPPDEPCLDEPREYGTYYLSIVGTRSLWTRVDTGRGEVVYIRPKDTSPENADIYIGFARDKSTPVFLPTATPTGVGGEQ